MPTSPTATGATSDLSSEMGLESLDDPLAGKQALLFFGPPNDPAIVRELLPKLREMFDVDWVDSASDGVLAAATRSYAALLTKLGTEGNLGTDVITALRESQG